MNKIDRAVVKAQAREIIKGKWFLLFVISLIVMVLTVNITMIFSSDFDDAFDRGFDQGFNQGFNSSNNNKSDFESFGEVSDFEAFGEDENFDFDDFVNDLDDTYNYQQQAPSKLKQLAVSLSTPIDIINIIFAPLMITLTGIYLSLVRRRPEEEFQLGKEIGNLFKNSFNETYVKKLVLVILRNLFTALLCCLFVIPGIVYYYSTYFSYQILNDNPDMKPSEAAKLSRKMVEGHRTELFMLNLSFIGWALLVALTCGIASIYVTPYVLTTDALYYENFRMRALQTGRISQADFPQSIQTEQGYGEPQQDSYYSYANPNNDTAGYYYNPTGNTQATEYKSPAQNYPTPVVDVEPIPNTDSNAETDKAQDDYYRPSSDYYTPPTDNNSQE